MHIVFATCLEQPAISASDRYLADALEQLGATVTGAPWNGDSVPFEQADGVVIRTTWDYFDHYPQFCAWLESLEHHGVQVFNSLPMLRWTIHKSYLFELERAGASLLPAVQVEPQVTSIQRAAQRHGWSQVVLKCLVSGTARGLSLFDVSAPEQIEQAIHAASPWSQFGVMLQPFMPEIISGGELSMVFVEGHFAHAVCKKPKANEFRIQSEYGGQYERVAPSQEIIDSGHASLNLVKHLLGDMPLYARVDGLIVNDVFKLMELELAEPELMFNHAPESANTLAAAVIQRLALSEEHE